MEVQIPSYKYKFRHRSTNSNKYSRKVVHLKLFILLLYSANFYFVAVLTWSVKVKNNPSLSDYRAIGLSDQRPVGRLSGCRTMGLQTNRLSDYSYAPWFIFPMIDWISDKHHKISVRHFCHAADDIRLPSVTRPCIYSPATNMVHTIQIN
jgi:hypothetical protein